jgi:hypothetical protein
LPGVARRDGARKRRNHEHKRRSHGVTNAPPKSETRIGTITAPLPNPVNALISHAA